VRYIRSISSWEEEEEEEEEKEEEEKEVEEEERKMMMIKAAVFNGPQVHYLVKDCSMSFKMHFLYSHLALIPVNCDAASDTHGECFHQDIRAMENRYKGKWSAAMLADYYWMVRRDAPEIQCT
jgi:CO dehydrogenase/acetyl-CoA synthase beta subunit